MKLTLDQSGILKDAIALISELVAEAQFVASPEALSLTALDPATVAMVDFKLLASSFSEYELDGSEKIAVNLVNFKQVLRRAGSSDSVTLHTVDGKLEITIRGSSTRTFHIPLIDMESQDRSLPDISYTAMVSTSSSSLAGAIDDADIVAESVALIAKDQMFTVAAQGDLSKVNIDIPQSEDTKIVLQESIDGSPVEQPIKARFSIEYLKKMMSGSKLSDQVTLHFRTDHPLKLEYKQLNKVSVTFILAPRVEND